MLVDGGRHAPLVLGACLHITTHLSSSVRCTQWLILRGLGQRGGAGALRGLPCTSHRPLEPPSRCTCLGVQVDQARCACEMCIEQASSDAAGDETATCCLPPSRLPAASPACLPPPTPPPPPSFRQAGESPHVLAYAARSHDALLCARAAHHVSAAAGCMPPPAPAPATHARRPPGVRRRRALGGILLQGIPAHPTPHPTPTPNHPHRLLGTLPHAGFGRPWRQRW